MVIYFTDNKLDGLSPLKVIPDIDSTLTSLSLYLAPGPGSYSILSLHGEKRIKKLFLFLNSLNHKLLSIFGILFQLVKD